MCVGSRKSADIKTPALPDLMPLQRVNPMKLGGAALSQIKGKGSGLSSFRIGSNASKKLKNKGPLKIDSKFVGGSTAPDNLNKIKDNIKKEKVGNVFKKIPIGFITPKL